MIVSDAGRSLPSPASAGFPVSAKLPAPLLIPNTVYDEIVLKKGGMPGAAEVAQAAWIQKASVGDRSIVDGLPNVLHEGEREAIALAKERGAQLLVDEIRARRVAIEWGIDVIGTLRILAEAKRLGQITVVQPIIAQMQVEPFCDGLAVALSLRPKRALLNDINPHAVHF
jgi:predicted nucleic acid-binding protein